MNQSFVIKIQFVPHSLLGSILHHTEVSWNTRNTATHYSDYTKTIYNSASIIRNVYNTYSEDCPCRSRRSRWPCSPRRPDRRAQPRSCTVQASCSTGLLLPHHQHLQCHSNMSPLTGCTHRALPVLEGQEGCAARRAPQVWRMRAHAYH